MKRASAIQSQSSLRRPSVLAAAPIFPSPIVWLNLICLDAPIVAVIWQQLFARTFHHNVTASATIALFLTAWLIYLADRFADARSVSPVSARSLRQDWCQRHQGLWLGVMIVVACADAWMILRRLEPRLLFVGLVIGLLSLAYLAINYSLGKVWRRVPLKELLIGSLFTLGTISTLLCDPLIDRSRLIVSSMFFAILCSLNCISIAGWERELDRQQGKESLATCWPALTYHFRAASVLLALVYGIAASLSVALRTLFLCMAFSAALLSLLDFRRNAIPLHERTALADLVLLTPLAVSFWLG